MLKLMTLYGFLSLIQPDYGPSEQMFRDLKSAQTQEAAQKIARDIWDSWKESSSAAADLMMMRAIEAQAAGDLTQARALYDRVIAIQPTYAEAWSRRATVFLALSDFEAALRDVNTALQLEPRHFGAWAGLGAVFENLDMPEAARNAYQEALSIYPLFPSAQQGLNRLRLKSEGRPV